MKIPQLVVRDTTGDGRFRATSTSGDGSCNETDRERTRRQAKQSQTRSDPEVCGHADRDAGGTMGGVARGMGARPSRRPAPAGVHHRLQEHQDREGDLRVARRERSRPRASRRRRSKAFATPTTGRTRSASTRRSSPRPTPARPRATRTHGCASRSTPSARPTGRRDRQGRSIYPEGFEELAKKLGRPLHPPGRDVRCIVSVGMLTEGWDCNTVTHIVGLRPFMSQLLCEQVVGRGLRRASYEIGDDGKADRGSRRRYSACRSRSSRSRRTKAAHAPAREAASRPRATREGRFRDQVSARRGIPQAIRNRVTMDLERRADIDYRSDEDSTGSRDQGGLPSNKGRPSLSGPGQAQKVDLNHIRSGRRFQELVFEWRRS